MRINSVNQISSYNMQKDKVVNSNFKGHSFSAPVVVAKEVAKTAGVTTGGVFTIIGALLAAGVALAKSTDNYINKNFTDKEKEDFIDQRIRSDCMFG